MDYYLDMHMPMSIERLSEHPGFKGVSVERGIGGGVPGSEPAYVAMCHYLFDTMEDFLAAFSPHAALLQGDIPNYTNVESIIQVSSVEIAQSRVGAPIGSHG
jgi:uncharacterized protein (TIGR02118 family)